MVDRFLDDLTKIVSEALTEAGVAGQQRSVFLAAYHRQIRDEYKYLLR